MKTELKKADSKKILTKTQKSSKKAPKWNFPLQKENLYIIGAGIIVIIIGYLLMATGISDEPALPEGKWNNPLAIIVAPFLLIIGYCIIIPFGIMKKFNKDDQEQKTI